jgi:hypothetical protein
MCISVTVEFDFDGTENTQFKKRPKIRLPFDSATYLSNLFVFLFLVTSRLIFHVLSGMGKIIFRP